MSETRKEKIQNRGSLQEILHRNGPVGDKFQYKCDVTL